MSYEALSCFGAKPGAIGRGRGLIAPENGRDLGLRRVGMAFARTILVNATLDFLAEVVERIFAYVAPSLSFGLYTGAEALFLYGLYMVFFGPRHGPL